MNDLFKKVFDLYDGKNVTVIGKNVFGETCRNFDCTGIARVNIVPQPYNPFFPDAPTHVALICVDGGSDYTNITIRSQEDLESVSERILIHE